MSRRPDRSDWIALGDRLLEISRKDFDEIAECVRDIVEAEEVIQSGRRRRGSWWLTTRGEA